MKVTVTNPLGIVQDAYIRVDTSLCMSVFIDTKGRHILPGAFGSDDSEFIFYFYEEGNENEADTVTIKAQNAEEKKILKDRILFLHGNKNSLWYVFLDLQLLGR